jgi:hypothetical protein
MKLFRVRRKPKSGEEDKELVLDTDAEAEAPAPDAAAVAEVLAQEEAPVDDPLDPDLVDIFREAKNEVEEITLASELEDIPTQDLLTDLVGVRRRLSIAARDRAKPNEGRK